MDFTLTKQGVLAGRLNWLCKDRMLTKSYDIRELRKVIAPKVLQNGFIEFAESPAYEELLQKYSNIENFYEKGGPTVETVFTQKEGNVAITVTNLPEKHDDVARYLAAEREALRTTLDVSISTERVDPFIWRAELRKKLQAKITLKFDKTPISEAVAAVARASKIPLVIQHDGLEFTALKHPDPPAVTQDFKDVTVEQALDTLLKPLKMKWELYKQVILVSQEGSNPFRGEMRIYNLSRLREPLNTIDEKLRKAVVPDSWDFGRTLKLTNNSLLYVYQTPELHEKVKAFLKTQPTK